MKQTNLRRAVNLTALVLAAGLLIGLLTGCPHKPKEKPEMVKITVKGDEGVTVNEPKTLELVKGTKWNEVKSKVKVNYKDGYEAKGWKLDGASGQDLEDGYVFNENKIVFALSKASEPEKITITVKAGDANVTVNEPKSFDVIKASKWSEVKAKIKVSYKDGYEESGWKLGSTSGVYLSDNDVLKENTTVFALSKQIGTSVPETVTITVKGDEGITVTTENTLKVDKNSKWQDLKEAAKNKITLKSNYEFVEWRLNDKDGEVLTDGYTFAENKTVFALSKKNTPSNPSIFKTDGNGKITGYTCPEEELPKNLVIPAKIGEETITGIGNGTFFNCNNIESVSFPESLTSINSWAFAYCFNLASVSFPKSLTSLGYRSFCYCTKLTSVNLPSKAASIGAGVFAECTKLTSLTVDGANENYKSVGNIIYTKDGFTLVQVAGSLNSVSIPESVTSIEDSAFSGCRHLTSVSFPQNLASIGNSAFASCTVLTSVDLPSKVASIGAGVFAGCTKLTSLTVDGANENYKSVGNIIYTKDGFTLVQVAGSLNSVSIPEGVTSIQGRALQNCKNLTQVNFPESLTSINDWAFANCEKLTKAVLPSNLQSIKTRAFSGCKNAEIKLPESITTIERWVFGSNEYDYCKKVLIKKGTHFERIKALVTGDPCNYPEDRVGEYEDNTAPEPIDPAAILKTDGNGIITGYTCKREELPKALAIPDKIGNEVITGISNSAFTWCEKIETVSFPAGLTSIDDFAFFHCRGLTSVSFPENLTSIGRYAFADCIELKSVHFSQEITSMSDDVFFDCKKLTSVNLPAKLESIGGGVFGGCINLTSLTVDEANKNYTSRDNVIYTKDMKTLVTAAGSIKSITIPEGVTSVSQRSFSSCEELTSVNFPQSLTSIGYVAFFDCDKLTSIILPLNLKYIGSGVFTGCINLTSLTVDAANENYIDRDNVIYTKDMKTLITAAGALTLQSLTIPEGVISIEEWTFRGFKNLTSVSFPQTLISIKDWAFEDCERLTSINLPLKLETIKDYAFSGCKNAEIKLPESITTIGQLVFGQNDRNYCKKVLIKKGAEFERIKQLVKDSDYPEDRIGEYEDNTAPEPIDPAAILKTDGNGIITGYTCTSAELPKALVIPAKIGNEVITGIRNHAFIWCKEIESVSFPEGLTFIDSVAFCGCKGLTSISFPQSLTSIGQNAFEGCEGLTSVHLPAKLESLGTGAFQGCINLISLTVAEDNEKYKTVDNIIYTEDMKSLTAAAGGLESVNIPEGVTSISGYAFVGCKRLTSVAFPQSLTSIDCGAFCKCEGLTSVNLPSDLEELRVAAFESCTGLTSIKLPAKLRYMEGRIFQKCINLKTVTIDEANEHYKIADNIIYTKDGLTLVQSIGNIESINIIEGVTSIAYGAFGECNNLTQVIFPQSLISIGDAAFNNCGDGLTSVELPLQLKTIGLYAFMNCTNAEIKLPESIETINHDAFLNCKKVLIKKGTHFERIKALVTGDPCNYPEDRVGEYE